MAKSQIAHLMVPITKRVKNDDGTITISGPVTDGALDLDKQIVDPVSASKALMDWFRDWGNIRQQHSGELPPAGKALALDMSGSEPMLTALIVEKEAVRLVEHKVYQGFSVGIADGTLDMSPKAKALAPNGVLYPSLINEVSVVDYPANPRCKFMIAKRLDGGEIMEIGQNEIMDPELHQVLGGQIGKALTDRVVKVFESGEQAVAAREADYDPDHYEVIGSAIVKRDLSADDRDKGPESVAVLPESWKAEMSDDSKPSAKVEKKSKGKKGENPFAKDDEKDDKKDPDNDGDDDTSPDGDTDDDAKSKGKKKGKKKAKKSKDAMPDDDTADAPKKGKKAKGKKGKNPFAKEDAKTMKSLRRLHDLLCPACAHKKSDAKRLKDVLDTEVFAKGLAAAAGVGDFELSAATHAFYAAHAVKGIKPEEFNELRNAARKAFLEAYPDLPSGGPDLTNAESFRRGFLPGATGSTASTMSHPDNFPKPSPLSPEQFRRGPLSANETRPSLVGGSSVARKSAAALYPNGVAGGAMGALHDAIAVNYPSICPAGSGLADETADRLGTPPEMYSPAPMPAPVDTKANATLTAVGDTASASKSSKAKAKKRIKRQVAKAAKKATRGDRKKIRKIQKSLRVELARPNAQLHALRAGQFRQPVVKATESVDKSETAQRALKLAKDIKDRNAGPRAIEELRGITSPARFAELMTADGD